MDFALKTNISTLRDKKLKVLVWTAFRQIIMRRGLYTSRSLKKNGRYNSARYRQDNPIFYSATTLSLFFSIVAKPIPLTRATSFNVLN